MAARMGLGIGFALLALAGAPAPARAFTIGQALGMVVGAAERAGAVTSMPVGRADSVRGAVRRALKRGHITLEQHDRWLARHRAAHRAVLRLKGVRRRELAAVVGQVDRLAATRRLTPGRMPMAFFQLRRNLAHWTKRPIPAPGARFTTRSDPAVLQYYPGRGLQFQPLATFGAANRLASTCRPGGEPCRRRALRRALDRAVGLAVPRGDFLTWEYQFGFGRGRPPWISGMAQATAMQALARGWKALAEPAYLEAARRALGAFDHRPPVGLSIGRASVRRYPLYSFDPSLRVLNGELQALVGLHDYARITGHERARRLFSAGDRAARAALRGFDTGAWSLYSTGGHEATLEYHRLSRDFLGALCRRTRRGAYCSAERRFTRYLHEPPRLSLAVLAPHPRAGARLPVSVSVSKISDVVLELRRAGAPTARRSLPLTRGTHVLRLRAGRRGRYRLVARATGPRGLRAQEESGLRVGARRP